MPYPEPWDRCPGRGEKRHDRLYNNTIPVSALNFSGSAPGTQQGGEGAGWSGQNYTFTYNASTIVHVSVTDQDSAFQDDPREPQWGSQPWAAHTQVLTSNVVIGGVTYLAGTQIDNEYELDVVDQLGITYRLVAVAIFASPTEPTWGSFAIVGYTFDGAWPPAGAILTSQAGTNQDFQEINPACFCKGTLIATPTGDVPVEALQVGDLVLTADGRSVPVRWHGHRRMSKLALQFQPRLRPIRLRKGSLGKGVPTRDLCVSPQHRLLARSVVVSRMIDGSDEALVAAKHLTGLPGITSIRNGPLVEYHHLMCDEHVVLVAEGALAESLYPGPQALQSVNPEQYEEICMLFPELTRGTDRMAPARPLLSGRRARTLVRRLADNAFPVFC